MNKTPKKGGGRSAGASPRRRTAFDRKVEGLTTMAGGTAHDFNNYLAAILGNNSIVLGSLPPDSPAVENAKQVEATSLAALDLAAKLALYSARGRITPKEVDIGTLIHELREHLALLVDKHIHFTCSVPEDCLTILAEPEQVRECIVQLVRNASDALIDREGTITVSAGKTELRRDELRRFAVHAPCTPGTFAWIRVEDTGCGITPETQERIFDPFFSTKIRGPGLGLAVVFGAMRSHHGAIRVQSEPDQGTCMQIYFPEDPLPPKKR